MDWLLNHLISLSPSMGPVLTGLAAALATLFAALITAWASNSSHTRITARRVEQLDSLSKRTAFWGIWGKAIQPLGTPDEIVEWNALTKEHLLTAAKEMEVIVAPHVRRVLSYHQSLERVDLAQKRFARLPKWRQILMLNQPQGTFHGLVMVAFIILKYFTWLVVFALAIAMLQHMPRYYEQAERIHDNHSLSAAETSEQIEALQSSHVKFMHDWWLFVGTLAAMWTAGRVFQWSALSDDPLLRDFES